MISEIDVIRAAWPEIASSLGDRSKPIQVSRNALVISAPIEVALNLVFFERHILAKIEQVGVHGISKLRFRVREESSLDSVRAASHSGSKVDDHNPAADR